MTLAQISNFFSVILMSWDKLDKHFLYRRYAFAIQTDWGRSLETVTIVIDKNAGYENKFIPETVLNKIIIELCLL